MSENDHVVLAKKDNRLLIISCAICLFLHAIMLAWAGWKDSPTWNEIQHLVAGISHWSVGRFELFQVNPPLIRMVAAVPVLAAHPKTNWSHYDLRPGRRSERVVANDFCEANQQRTFWLVTLARWACIPFSVLGACVCFQWSRELYGIGAGTLALVLWCFSPAILGHGHLITPDVGAAALGVAAAYAFWHWLKWRTWWASLGAGIAMGFAELAKTTWIVLFVAWPLIWFAWRLLQMRAERPHRVLRESGQMMLVLFSALCVLNAGYGFEGTFRRLGDYQFVSELFGGPRDPLSPAWERNRFAEGSLAKFPVPLPKDYLMGIDVQKGDFEQGLPSYLRGAWADQGWWYYYLYALAIKEPLGTWCLVILALGATIFGQAGSTSWRDEIVLIVLGLVILIFISSQTGFSVHSRYVILALPFLFAWTSKVARVFATRSFSKKQLVMATVVLLALTWSISSSVMVYPHSISHFNELAVVLPTSVDPSYPKPMEEHNKNHSVLSSIISAGPRHLLDSNIDWGQDLLYLKEWLHEHPGVKLDGLAYYNSYPATLAFVAETPKPPAEKGTAPISAELPSGLSGQLSQLPIPAPQGLGPKPGWYALSVNYIYGRDQQYRYFLHFEPKAMAGYSIYIYHVTLDEANHVRRELGLDEVEADEKEVATRDGGRHG